MLSLRRATSLLVLAVYVTASAAAGLLHDHSDGAHRHAPAIATDCHDHCSHSHDSTSPRLHQHSAPLGYDSSAQVSNSEEHSDCSICKLLSQRTLTVEVFRAPDVAVQITELRITAPVPINAPVARAYASRAPPYSA